MHRGSADEHARFCADGERHGIGGMARGENLVSRALQQNLQVGENVKRAVEADDARGGSGGRLLWRSGLRCKPVERFFFGRDGEAGGGSGSRLLWRSRLRCKRVDRFLFGGEGPQNFQQIRGLENLNDERRQLARLQIAAGGAQDAKETDKRTEAAAIEIGDFGELQYDVLGQWREFFDFLLKVAGLVAGEDAAFATDEHDVADRLALQGELHGTAKLSQNFRV